MRTLVLVSGVLVVLLGARVVHNAERIAELESDLRRDRALLALLKGGR